MFRPVRPATMQSPKTGIRPVLSSLDRIPAPYRFQAQSDVTSHSNALCESVRQGDWRAVSKHLQALISVEPSSVINPFIVLRNIQSILLESQLTLDGPIKLKLCQLLNAYSLIYYYKQIVAHEAYKQEWKDIVTKAVSWTEADGCNIDDAPYMHAYAYHLSCANAVVDLAKDTHKIDWWNHAANVLSTIGSLLGLCDSQVSQIASDLLNYAKDYLNRYTTQEWYTVVCILLAYKSTIRNIDATLTMPAFSSPPSNLTHNTSEEMLSVAVLQIQRVLTKECCKLKCTFPSDSWQIIYTCVEALEQALLKSESTEVCLGILKDRRDPHFGERLIGLEFLVHYHLYQGSVKGSCWWYVRARLAELAHTLKYHKNPEIAEFAKNLLVVQKTKEINGSKVYYSINNPPVDWEEYQVKLQENFQGSSDETNGSINELAETDPVLILSALQQTGAKAIERRFISYLSELRVYYQSDELSHMVLFLGQDPVPVKEAFIRLTITKNEDRRQQEAQFRTNIRQTEDENRLQSLNHYEELYSTKEPIEIEPLFTPGADGKFFQKLLVSGRAGIGKSILCAYIANRWAENTLWPHFQAIFWIPLRNLNQMRYPVVREGYNWVDVLNKECFQNKLTNEDCMFMRTQVRRNPEQFMFLLDGYDELTPEARTGYLQSALNELRNHQCCIVTSRPQQASDLRVDRHLEIMGFSHEDVEKYVRSFFNSLGEKTSSCAERLLSFLKSQQMIWGIAHIPLQLAMICQLSAADQLLFVGEEQRTVSWLYHRLVENMFKIFLIRTGQAEETTPQFLLQESYDPLQRTVEQIAYSNMLNNSIFFLEDDLAKAIKSTHENADRKVLTEHFQAISNCGFLRPAGNREYYFIHLTFQEYFAAGMVARVLQEEKTDSNAYLSMRESLLLHRYNPRLQFMLWFVAGHLAANVDALEQFLAIITAPPADLLGVYERDLLLHCLIESGEPSGLTLTKEKLLLPLLDAVNGFGYPAYLASNELVQHGAAAASEPMLEGLLRYLHNAYGIYDCEDRTFTLNVISDILGQLGAAAATPDIIHGLLYCANEYGSKTGAFDALDKIKAAIAVRPDLQKSLAKDEEISSWLNGSSIKTNDTADSDNETTSEQITITESTLTRLLVDLLDKNIRYKIVDNLFKEPNRLLDTYEHRRNLMKFITEMPDNNVRVKKKDFEENLKQYSLFNPDKFKALPEEVTFGKILDSMSSSECTQKVECTEDSVDQLLMALLSECEDDKYRAQWALGMFWELYRNTGLVFCPIAITSTIIIEKLLIALQHENLKNSHGHADALVLILGLLQLDPKIATPAIINKLLIALQGEHNEHNFNFKLEVLLKLAMLNTEQVPEICEGINNFLCSIRVKLNNLPQKPHWNVGSDYSTSNAKLFLALKTGSDGAMKAIEKLERILEIAIAIGDMQVVLNIFDCLHDVMLSGNVMHLYGDAFFQLMSRVKGLLATINTAQLPSTVDELFRNFLRQEDEFIKNKILDILIGLGDKVATSEIIDILLHYLLYSVKYDGETHGRTLDTFRKFDTILGVMSTMPEVIDQVSKALIGANVKDGALEVLYELRIVTKQQVIDKLLSIAMQKENSSKLRCKSIQALRNNEAAQTAEVVGKLLMLAKQRDDDSDVRCSAIQGLRNNKAADNTTVCDKLLILATQQGNDVKVRCESIQALRNNEAAQTAEVVDKLLMLAKQRDDDSDVRCSAIQGLRNNKAADNTIVFDKLRILATQQDNDVKVRCEAIETLVDGVTIDIEHYYIESDSDIEEDSDYGVTQARHRQYQLSIPTDSDYGVTQAPKNSTWSPMIVCDTLLTLATEDSNKQVKRAVLQMLRRSAANMLNRNEGTIPSEMVDKLFAIFKMDNLAEDTVKSLATNKLQSMVDKLLNMLQSDNEDIRYSAVKILSKFCVKPDVIHKLMLVLLNNSNKNVQAAVATAFALVLLNPGDTFGNDPIKTRYRLVGQVLDDQLDVQAANIFFTLVLENNSDISNGAARALALFIRRGALFYDNKSSTLCYWRKGQLQQYKYSEPILEKIREAWGFINALLVSDQSIAL